MRVIKVRIGWSGPGFGSITFHNQRIGAEKPRVLSVTVDRGFCPQSLYGLRTYDHKYTIRLSNSDGALDKYRAFWARDQSAFGVYAADDSTIGSSWPTDAGATDLKFARDITRVTVTTSEVILESDGGAIRNSLSPRLADFYSLTYNTFSQNKPQLWAAGRVLVDVDPLQIVGANTDFDTGSRPAELSTFYVDGTPSATSAPVGAGDFSKATTLVEGKRTAALLHQPSIASPATAQDAFAEIMLSSGYVPGMYENTWARGTLNQAALIGVSAREQTRLETIEKIIAGFDAGLTERSDGKIAVVCLRDFYQYTTGDAGYDLTQRKIERIEVETAPVDGLGRMIAWNQNDAVHSARDAQIADPSGLTAPFKQRAITETFDDVYTNAPGVKERVFQTWFNDDGTGSVALAAAHLGGFFATENMLINVTAPGFDLQDLNPGDKVLLTHERFDLGVMPNAFQLLNLRYDMMQLSTSLQLIGKKRYPPSTAIFTCNFTGANNSTFFVDDAENNTIIAYGDAKIQTTGGQHGLFDGAGDYLSVSRAAGWGLGSAFTVEWVGAFSAAGFRALVGQWESPSGPNNAWLFGLYYSQLYFSFSQTGGVWSNHFATFSPTIGQIYHLVVEADATRFRIYIDGLNVYSYSGSTPIFAGSNQDLVIGKANGYSVDFDGKIFGVRISPFARYATDTSFAVPPLPFT